MKLYYLDRNGFTSAPTSAAEIVREIRAWRLSPDTLVCEVGATEWTPIKDLPEFSAEFRRAVGGVKYELDPVESPVWTRRETPARAPRAPGPTPPRQDAEEMPTTVAQRVLPTAPPASASSASRGRPMFVGVGIGALCLFTLLGLVWCSGRREVAPAVSSAARPTMMTPSASIPVDASVVQPDAPQPADLALDALDDGRYLDVCPFLVSEGFSPDVCEWIALTAEGTASGQLSTRTLESFLRAQHVRRVSGTVVDWYDQSSSEYEVRVGGRAAILQTTETSYTTTGRFSMWAQESGSSDEVLNSGREVTVTVYREWPIAELIIEMMRARGASRIARGRDLIEELLAGWHERYCYVSDAEGMGDCHVDSQSSGRPRR